MSTNQPPNQQMHQDLLALVSGTALTSSHSWHLRYQLEKRNIPSVKPTRVVQASVSAQQQSDLAQIGADSRDVLLMLATADFWATTRVNGMPWSADAGVSACAISLQPFTVTAASQAWSHTLPAVTAADYQASVVALHTKADGSVLELALAQTKTPQTWLALALGLGTDPDRYRYTCLVADAMQAVVTVAVQRLKHQMRVPRPDDLTKFPMSQVQARIEVPGFSAYPGGHATLMHALAVVLSHITGCSSGVRDAMHDIAGDVANNRVVMGLHTDIDTQAGEAFGRAFGQWMVDATAHPDYRPWAALVGAATAEWP